MYCLQLKKVFFVQKNYWIRVGDGGISDNICLRTYVCESVCVRVYKERGTSFS